MSEKAKNSLKFEHSLISDQFQRSLGAVNVTSTELFTNQPQDQSATANTSTEDADVIQKVIKVQTA